MDSLCRKVVEGEKFKAADYSGMIAYRGKVPTAQVAEEVGGEFSNRICMVIGVKGWHILMNPIDSGEFVSIAAFAVDDEYVRKGQDHVATAEEVVGYFPGRNDRVGKMLKAGPQRLEFMTLRKLEAFYNSDLCITNFGDAANGMLPHIAASMSTGFIGVTTFLREGLNPLIDRLSRDATNAEIADLIPEASACYDVMHRSVAQRLLDFASEQGPLWSGGAVAVKELTKRPKFLWACADCQR